MPLTVNSANQASITPLARAAVEGEARTTAANLAFTSRPRRWVSLDLRYRAYEYDNRTPAFVATQRVAYDNAPVSATFETEPFSLIRHGFDADVRVAPTAIASAGVGFSRLEEERTHRIFEATTDNVVRITFDSVGASPVTLRTKYEHAERRGEGAASEIAEELLAIGEQPGMRHFDIAARDRDRVTLVGSVMPVSTLILNASLAAGKDDYLQSVFGLRDNTHRVFSLGLDATPADPLTFGLSYSFERYQALSRSRQASPGDQFNDPSRNWASEGTDRVHSVVVSGGVTDIGSRVDLSYSYDFSRVRSLYEYVTGPVPNRTLPEEVVVATTLPTPAALPLIRSDLQRGTLDAVYSLTTRLGVGVSYWYESYRVEDFTLDADANVDLARGRALLIGYLYRPYTANTLWGRLIYRW
jgi:hypothetical protein